MAWRQEQMPKLGTSKKNRNELLIMGLGRHLREVRQSSYSQLWLGPCTPQPKIRCFQVNSSDNIFADAHALYDTSVMGSVTRLFMVNKRISSGSCRTIGFGERHSFRPCVATRREDYCLPVVLAFSVERHFLEAIPVSRPPFHAKSCLLRKSNSI
jgi:hypothetical protein